MDYRGFVGPSYQTAAHTGSVERSVNWFVEVQESAGSKTPAALIPTPGVRELIEAPGLGAGRGIWSLNDRCLAAFGESIYEVLRDRATGEWSLSERLLGGITGTDPVQFASTGFASREVIAVGGGRGYILSIPADPDDRISTVAAPELDALVDDNPGTNLTHCAFMNSRFVVFDRSLSRFWISRPNFGTQWNQLDVSSRSQAGDELVAMAVLDNDLWLFGSETTEVWYDSGAADQPFVPRPGAFFQYGALAPYSIAELDGTWCWLGREQEGEGTVWRTTRGYSDPERISTFGVERAMAQYGSPEDAIGWAYKHEGHSFYVLTFTGDPGGTWVYDARTGFWHEWLSWSDREGYIPLETQFHARFRGESLVLDRRAGSVYALDGTRSVDAGGGLVRRMRRAPVIGFEGAQIQHDRIRFDIEAGTAPLPPNPGHDPTMTLRWNDNAGRGEWSQDRIIPLGARGDYFTEAYDNRLGTARNRVYEVWIADPVPISILGASLDVTVGAH